MLNKRGINLEMKLLKVRHMSRSKFFYLGFSNFCFKIDIFEMETNGPR